MKIFTQMQFIKSAAQIEQAPVTALPWICMAGRSNVGKSSLINKLANRKRLAKVAATPGKTALLNFYDLGGLAMLVDLPGYGFANVSKAEKARWGAMMENFFAKAANLKATCLIIDARHEPSRDDVDMRDYLLARDLPFVVLCNKIDKLNASQKAEAQSRAEFFAAGNPYVLCSAEKGTAISDVQALVVELLGI